MIGNLELLKRSDIFSGLTDEQLVRVLDLARPQVFGEGQVILEEDQPGTSCYFITAGRVDIEVRAPFPGRGPQKIATVKAGETFGELSLVDGSLRSASARAIEPTEVLAFDSAALQALMEEDARIGYRIMRNIAQVVTARLRSMNMKLRNALTDVFYY